MKTFRLTDGVNIPALGFGTWELTGADCSIGVASALEIGYRHIDTADRYGNHHEVGQAIKNSGIAREELFITTKVWHSDLEHPKVLESVDRFLSELQIPYIDLLLVHWPNHLISIDETFSAMAELQAKGTIRAYGVSNFTIHHIEDVMAKGCQIVNNQVELHPSFNQMELKNYCDSKNILVTAYSPLGRGAELQNPTVVELSQKYGVSPAQVILNWIVSRGIVAIPKSKTPERIKDNFNSLNWQMEPQDIDKMNAIPQSDRLLVTDWQEFDY